MQVLVSYAWIEGEADELGLAVSDEAVSRSFRRQRRANFQTRRAFRRFLRDSGQTAADIRFRVRIDMLSTRIRRRVTAAGEATVTDAQVDAYHAEQGNVCASRSVATASSPTSRRSGRAAPSAPRRTP
jgi:foldase protein PrsA